jgi:hypothetical protein
MTPEEIDQLSAENLNHAIKERVFGYLPPGHPEQVAYLVRTGLARKHSKRSLWLANGELKWTPDYTWLVSAWELREAMLRHPDLRKTAASLTMTANNKILTDSPEGTGGVLIVKALTIGGVARPAGTYGAATAKWVEGKVEVIVRP